MTNIKYFFFGAMAIIAITFFACVSNPTTAPTTTALNLPPHVLFIVNEGNFGKGNATLDAFEPNDGVYHSNIFQSVNGRALGDNANDVVLGGLDSLYIVVNNSDSIVLINWVSGVLLRTYAVPKGTSPYKMAMVNDSQAAVTGLNSNSVLLLNVHSGNIDRTIPVGANPEGIARAGNYLCVCASDYSGATSNINIINVSNATVNTFKAVADPTAVVALGDTLAIAVCGGTFDPVTYAHIPNTAALVFFNPQTATILSTLTLPGAPIKMALDGNILYVPLDSIVLRVDVAQRAVRDTFLTHISVYGIGVDNITHWVYLSDAKNSNQSGELYVYDNTAHLLSQWTTGIDPGTMLIVRGL